MTGAIEFLRKAKAICESMSVCTVCPIDMECKKIPEHIDEADLVRKVMAYQIKEEDK